MSPPRIHVPLSLSSAAAVELPEAAVRHLVHVLKMTPGEALVLFNGEGGEYDAVLESVNKRGATARVRAFRNANRESHLQVTLAQAVAKSENMDYAIQKAVELGVTEIQPLLTERSVVRLTAERWERKVEHWQGIATSACEQCGRNRVPKVLPVAEMLDWVATAGKTALKLVLSPRADRSLRTLPASGKPILLLVGPEGGLSDVEINLAELNGFFGMTLGPRVLRTETAGVVALAVVQALWGDLASV
jgi:16S rRNA (uracil1498-N3)-methyltransferase